MAEPNNPTVEQLAGEEDSSGWSSSELLDFGKKGANVVRVITSTKKDPVLTALNSRNATLHVDTSRPSGLDQNTWVLAQTGIDYNEQISTQQSIADKLNTQLISRNLALDMAGEISATSTKDERQQFIADVQSIDDLLKEDKDYLISLANSGDVTTINSVKEAIAQRASQAQRDFDGANVHLTETISQAEQFGITQNGAIPSLPTQSSGTTPTEDSPYTQFIKPITDESTEEEKKNPVQAWDVIGDSDPDKDKYIAVTSEQYLAYLQDPNKYTDTLGRGFAKSPLAANYLKTLKPSEQCQAVTEVSEMLHNSPDESYPLKDGQTPNPGSYVYDDGTAKYGLTPKTEQHKQRCETLKEAGVLTGGPTASTATQSSGSNENNASSGSANTSDKDVKPPEKSFKEEFNKSKYDENSKKNLLSIGAFNDIPYFRVNGYSKIRFPNVWDNGLWHIPIMGLPPMRIQKNIDLPIVSKNAFDLVTVDGEEPIPEMYAYDEDAQLNQSFLKLTIHPIDVEFINNGANGNTGLYNERKNAKEKALKDKYKEKYNDSMNQYNYTNRSVVLWDVEYNFAIQAKEDTITINHTNNYNSTSLEQIGDKSLATINSITNGITGYSNVGGGFSSLSKSLGSKALSLGGQAQTAFDNMIKGLNSAMKESGVDSSLGSKFIDDLSTLLKEGGNFLSGSRVDMPDIWTSSSTGISHQFTIELRTLSPDPLSIQYHKDILLPLYILYTLALPQDTGRVTYKTPVYIYCNLDKFFKIKLGAITNMNVSIPTSEVNMKRAPRHVTVQLTIRDLYSVMKQDVWDIDNKKIDSSNGDTTDKDEFINNFVKYAEDLKDQKKTVTNEAYYLTEFARIPAYMAALENYKLEQAAKNLSKLNLASVNASTTSKTPNNPVSSDTAKLAQSLANNVTKSAQILKDAKGKTSFITSIGNAITGVTNGVKNIMAGVQSAIQPVRNLINTGKLVMNSVNGLKNSVKLIGQTANLEGILNGQFSSSVGFAFNNVANATGVVEAISDACAGGGSFKTIMKNLGQVPERVLTNNLANAVTDSGSLNLSNQIRNAACTWYGLANMFGQTYPNVVGLKDLTSRGSDITSIATVLFDNLGGIANGLNSFTTGQSVGSTSGNTTQVDPLLSQYVSATLKGATAKGVITAGEASSNQKVQSELAEATQVAKEQLTATPDVVVKLEGAYAEAIKEAKKSYGEGNKARAAAFMQAVSDQIPPEELKTTVDQLEKKFEVYLSTAKNNEKEARQLALTEILEKGNR